MTGSREQLENEGYTVIRGLADSGAIDRVLDTYRSDIVPSTDYFYRQSGDAWLPNVLTEAGFVRDSFLDVHDMKRHEAFAAAVRGVLCAPRTMRAIDEATGRAPHALVQSMLFDLNAATRAHRDDYYLDSTSPPGELVAAWVALEDIHESAGRFFVIPGSQRDKLVLSDRQLADNETFLRWVEETYGGSPRTAPALAKGDVLLWSSRTIHGSFETRDPRRSRKSLTAHYLPMASPFGNIRGPHAVQPVFRSDEGVFYRATNNARSRWHGAASRAAGWLKRRLR